MRVKILTLNERGDSQRVVGSLFLDADGEVALEVPRAEDQRVLRQLLRRPMADPTNYGYVVTSDIFPREWLLSLPANLSNGYLNAELVEAL